MLADILKEFLTTMIVCFILSVVPLLIAGKKIRVMHVKGSGWDMSDIDYPGLPAVELDPLLQTTNLKTLDDFSMVNLQRKNLIDSKAPNPSVETLLHAFIPHKYVDHTHANSILSLIDQPNDIEICKKVFGNKEEKFCRALTSGDVIGCGFNLDKMEIF